MAHSYSHMEMLSLKTLVPRMHKSKCNIACGTVAQACLQVISEGSLFCACYSGMGDSGGPNIAFGWGKSVTILWASVNLPQY